MWRRVSSVSHSFLPPHRHITSHHDTNKPPCCNNFWLFFHFSLPQQIQLLFLLSHCHWPLFRYSFFSLFQFLSSPSLSRARFSFNCRCSSIQFIIIVLDRVLFCFHWNYGRLIFWCCFLLRTKLNSLRGSVYNVASWQFSLHQLTQKFKTEKMIKASKHLLGQ